MHIDLNSCFATVAQQANPLLRGKPLVVAAYASPRGCVLAASVEAKRLGIKTGMRVMDAKLLFRDVIVKTNDPEMVRDVHTRLKRICSVYSPSVVPKSIDELVIDFSPVEKMLGRDLSDIAQEIKYQIRQEIGEWMICSIGIGTNRFLAKTGAGLHKPDGLDVITNHNIRSIYNGLTLVDLCGINTRFEARLNMHGIFTPLQFLDAPAEFLKRQVFKSIIGWYWYKKLKGWEVESYDMTTQKSYGQEYSLGKQTSDPIEISRILLRLCEKMGRRLRDAGMTAQGIHIGLMYKDYTHWHQGRMKNGTMYTTMELYKAAHGLLSQQPRRKIVAKISVSCYALNLLHTTQMGLFEQREDKLRLVSNAMDTINDKYGEFVITPALMLNMDNTVHDRIAFGSVRELEDLYG